MPANHTAVLLARTNGGNAAINQQVRALTRFAAANNIKVVGKVILPHCAADDFDVQSHVTALLGRLRGHNDFGMVIITDLSRLSRRNVPHAMNLIKKLGASGVIVATPDLSVTNDRLWQRFPLPKQRSRRHRRRNEHRSSILLTQNGLRLLRSTSKKIEGVLEAPCE